VHFFEDNQSNLFSFRPAFTRHFENDIAFILCSSGSTGLSKAICLSQASIASTTNVALSGNSLNFSSLYWMSGIMSSVLGTISGVSRVITRQPFSANWMIDIVEKYKIVFFFGCPTYIAQLLNSSRLHNANMTSLQMIAISGAALTDHYKVELEKHFNCVVAYGMTELGSTGCNSMIKYKPGSVGTPLLNFSVRVSCNCLFLLHHFLNRHIIFKICDEDGAVLGKNKIGEIQARTPFKFLGYYKNEKETHAVLTEDGFFKTGDLGCIDENNLVSIVGRKKEIMKYAAVGVRIKKKQENLLNLRFYLTVVGFRFHH
jgi:4-coumarate--CoA ligase